jgi:hypothetical protein
MIPSDVASSLRLPLLGQRLTPDAAAKPVLPTQQIADVLSNLVPGQRILAEIQALLPNGNYRAVVAQRAITLALPFSAQVGDTLELEVTEKDGKLTLAVVTNRSDSASASQSKESAATSFSPTGRLIGNLISETGQEGKRAQPAPLNGNLALVETMPRAADLAPVLKQALTQSGVFYEAHQARWVAGELPTATLKQEPQARFASAPTTATINITPEANSLSKPPVSFGNIQTGTQVISDEQGTSSQNKVTLPPNIAIEAKNSTAEKLAATYGNVSNPTTLQEEQIKSSAATSSATVNATPDAKTNDASRISMQSSQQASTTGNPIPRDLVPIVQQQLDALATQNYAWQGQIWPGQQMQWEIGENPDGTRSAESDAIARWQTRLKLALPTLGGINAVLNLNPAGEVNITVTADSASSEVRLRDSTTLLSQQMESAGLKLTQILVEHGEAIN